MSRQDLGADKKHDEAPGQDFAGGSTVGKYFAGLCLSLALTFASFWVADTNAVWQQAVPVLLASLAIAQMGIHLVFFLHLSSGPEGVNNILALAFGVFVVGAHRVRLDGDHDQSRREHDADAVRRGDECASRQQSGRGLDSAANDAADRQS